MRIAVMNYWFSEGMGYSENLLPSAMARLGHDVHLITSEAQIYFNSPAYARTYQPFLGPPRMPRGTQRVGDVTVHRLPLRPIHSLHGVRSLISKLRELKPEIVQALEPASLMTLEAAFSQPVLRYRLFLESHIHRSVFGPQTERLSALRNAAWRAYSVTIGRLVGAVCDRCYAISSDTAEIVQTYFGISPSKVEICSLGVDTTLFRADPEDEEIVRARSEQRRELGFTPKDIVCIYTGRFSQDKNPLLLAEAVATLQARGKPFVGLFVGDGEQAENIRIQRGCITHPFVPSRELPKFYWASDIGVWPKQESTSQLDAAACGIPVIIGDKAQVHDRVDGNGAVYREDNVEDLARVIETMANPTVRQELGQCGAKKMQRSYSWEAIARKRIQDYERSLFLGYQRRAGQA